MGNGSLTVHMKKILLKKKKKKGNIFIFPQWVLEYSIVASADCHIWQMLGIAKS